MPLRATKSQARALQLTLEGAPDTQKKRKPPIYEEAMHQAALFAYLNQLRPRHPCLRWIFATLNGVYIPTGLRLQMLDQGLTPGVVDVMDLTRRIDDDGTVWSGIVIDLKAAKGAYPTDDQKLFLLYASANGFRAYICPGCLDAWHCLAAYHGITGPDHKAEFLIQQENHIRQIVAASK